MTGFDERYERLAGPARELLDSWLAAEPEPVRGGRGTTGPVAPATPRERLLVQVWQDVLERDRIGVDEDYIALGGDSIRSIVIVARAEAAGLRISTQDLFDARTIRSLALLGEPVTDPRPVTAAAPGADRPLTAMQEGILFHTLAAERGVYLAQVGCDLLGDLDVAAFRRAWQLVLDRHEALRATFHWSGGAPPRQRVAPVATARWDGRDLRELPIEERESALHAYDDGLLASGMDLGEAPLLRLGLFRTAEAEHRFVLTHHHLLLDGWSQHLVLADVLDAYAALRADRRPQVPDRRGPDAGPDAVARDLDPVDAQAFWRAELDGSPGASAISAADGTEPVQVRSSVVAPDVAAGVRAYCREAGVTLAVAVQAGWALALARLRAVDDVVVGVTVSGRSAAVPGLTEAVGMFINTVPMRVRYRADDRLPAWLAGLHRRRVVAVRHEHDSLVRMARWVGLPAGRALFDSIVVVENFPAAATGLRPPAGLRIGRVSATIDEAYPLVLQVTAGDRLELVIRSAPSAFTADDVDRLRGVLVAFLAAVATGPDLTMGELVARLDGATEHRSAARRAELHAAAARSLARGARAPLRLEDG